MDIQELIKKAAYAVGDEVYVNGLEPATVLSRFYRRSTRMIMYGVKTKYGSTSVVQDRLMKNPVGPDHWGSARTRGRRR